MIVERATAQVDALRDRALDAAMHREALAPALRLDRVTVPPDAVALTVLEEPKALAKAVAIDEAVLVELKFATALKPFAVIVTVPES